MNPYHALLRLGFRLLYNEMAWAYDAVSWIVSAGEWRAWQRSALKHLNTTSGTLILEVAHGTANMQRALHAAGYAPVGLDLSKAMGRIGRRKLRRAGFVPQLVQGDARHLPFSAGTFPAIVCTFPTSFIIESQVIREMYRVLQPDGRLVLVASATFTGHSLIKRILDWLYGATGQHGEWPPDVRRRFEAAGFKLTSHDEPCTISVAQVVVAHK